LGTTAGRRRWVPAATRAAAQFLFNMMPELPN
jgi:hypothetical protein